MRNVRVTCACEMNMETAEQQVEKLIATDFSASSEEEIRGALELCLQLVRQLGHEHPQRLRLMPVIEQLEYKLGDSLLIHRLQRRLVDIVVEKNDLKAELASQKSRIELLETRLARLHGLVTDEIQTLVSRDFTNCDLRQLCYALNRAHTLVENVGYTGHPLQSELVQVTRDLENRFTALVKTVEPLLCDQHSFIVVNGTEAK
jgi:hypothetical protein